MDLLEELKERTAQIISVAEKINEAFWVKLQIEAPIIVYQKLSSELVKIMKENSNTTASEIPEAMKIINAMDVLENIYPRVSRN